MIGRELPVALLSQVFEGAAADRACHLFTVHWGRGVGKSRLFEEFASRLEDVAPCCAGVSSRTAMASRTSRVQIVKEAAGLTASTPPMSSSQGLVVLEDDEHQESCARASLNSSASRGREVPRRRTGHPTILRRQVREGPRSSSSTTFTGESRPSSI